MIKRLAIIQSGVVQNVILWDDQTEFVAPDGYEAVENDQAGPQWLYDGTQFTEPEPPVSAADEAVVP